MIKARALYTDRLICPRWYAGEIGEVTSVEPKEEKYDYLVLFEPNCCICIDDPPFWKKGDMPRREIYFFKNEVEILNGTRRTES